MNSLPLPIRLHFDMTPIIKTLLNRFAKGLILLIVIVLVVRLFFYDDIKSWVSTKVQAYITELDYGDLQIDNLDLSVFQHFPNISVQLHKVRFYEKKDSIRPDDTQPILYTEQLNLSFSSWELIRHKNLVVTMLESENGELHLLTYEDNTTNLERAFGIAAKQNKSTQASSKDSLEYDTNKSNKPVITPDKPNSKKELLSIALEAVYFNNFILSYTNPSENYTSQVKLESLSGKLLLNETGLSCDLSSSFEISKSSDFPMIAELGPAALKLNLDFVSATEVINIHDGSIRFKTITADLKGSYNNSNEKYIDITFDASSNDLALLSKLVKADVLIQNSALVEKTDIILNGHIEGGMEDNIPKIDLNFSVSDLSLIIPQSKGGFTNVGFDGELHTGEADDFSGALLAVRNLRGKLPGGSMSGNFSLRNFKNPNLKSNMNVSLDLDDLDNIFNITSIDSLKGKLNFTSNLDGRIQLENESTIDSIGSWSLNMDDINFKYLPSNKFITKLQGTISDTKNDVVIENLSLFYDKSDVLINGELKNFYQFIFNKGEDIEAFITINSNQIFTSDFILKPESIPAINDRISDLKLKAHLTMRDNNSYDYIVPKISAEIAEFSFDLDKLPGIKSLTGNLEFQEISSGFDIDLIQMQAELAEGKITADGKVLIPSDFEILDIKTNFNLTNLPEDYIWDLIKEMSDLELNQSKLKPLEELTLVSGNIRLSAIMELFPFAMHSSELTSKAITLKLPDNDPYDFQNLNLKLDSLYFHHDTLTKSITGIRKTLGELKIDAFNSQSLKKNDIVANFNGNNDQFKIDILNPNDSANGKAGYLNIDISEVSPSFEAFYELKDISAESLTKEYSSEIEINGDLNASFKFSGIGSSFKEISSSLKGNIEISSDSLIFNGIDLDKILKKYNRSQKFNLADVSAYVLAGPFGAVVTKGSDFTSLIAVDLKPEDKTIISKALARWSLNDGVLQSEDVAFRTNLSRVAFNGSLDIAKDSIPGFTVYVVDKNGCSLMRQTISGKTDNIEVGKLKVAKTLLGSIINLVNKVVGVNCEMVYDGEIAHPNFNK